MNLKEFIQAAKSGDIEKMDRHIKETKSTRLVNEKTTAGVTALMMASTFDQIESVKYLIEKGANINESDQDGGTSFFRTIFFERFKTAKYLLKKGANPNNVNRSTKNKTALQEAVNKNKMEFVLLFARYGKELNQEEKELLNQNLNFKVKFKNKAI